MNTHITQKKIKTNVDKLTGKDILKTLKTLLNKINQKVKSR